ncbi:aldehyde dehydrogenase [Mycolicibacterium fluoranthenivorans]|uniref:Probable aldehyde dehydrogenase n=5 Tax=Mycolicibacterium fluoranthenivorans TaxID=258505 RepID=A0A7X5U5B0_9MYCO|nr:aldehyde dehydrogenase [Mycolicibacterium fluoranthenivorans]
MHQRCEIPQPCCNGLQTSLSDDRHSHSSSRRSTVTVYARPGTEGALMSFKSRYGNFIGGQWVAPVAGRYFENPTPVTGQVFCEIPRSDEADVEAALDAAHAAAPGWGKTSPAERAVILNRVADRIEENLESIAVAESWDNGKPVRETLNADIPLAVDHFRYFAGVLRAQEGSLSQIDEDTVAYHFHEPLGVVGQIIPWNFPILMAVWKLAPALAAGNAVVLKPAEQTPASILYLFEVIGDLLPAGVVNIVNGFGVEAGKPLASSNRIAKIAFTGETTTGRLIMQYASQNLIPVTLELGGKSPNIFFSDVLASDDAYQDKALEGFTMFALNQGEVCTCPSRSLIQADIYDEFLALAAIRTKAVRQGDPLDTETMIGAQASNDQLEKILSYIEIGKGEGAQVLTGGERAELGGDLGGGFYVAPTIFTGHNKMRIFQEEIFGPVVAVTSFTDYADAIAQANDTLYGLGAGVWSRSGNTAYRAGRDIKAGRVWTNCYHQYPAHAAFGGYKQSGIGRENHKMMLDHYQQTKNLLVSYSENAAGFF